MIPPDTVLFVGFLISIIFGKKGFVKSGKDWVQKKQPGECTANNCKQD